MERKGTLYPPRNIREELQLQEGDTINTLRRQSSSHNKNTDPLKVLSEFNIYFNAKKAIKLINEVGKKSETEIEEEIEEAIKD